MAARGQWMAVGGIVTGLMGALALGVAFTPEVGQVQIGDPAPPFRAVTVPGGDTVSLADYKGEVLLLNIWATWCKPCEAEMPSMQRLHEELGPAGVRVLAVSVDAGKPGPVHEWVQDRRLTFDILHDASGRIERIYQTTGVPESFVIDREGVIVKKVIGALPWDHPAQQLLFRRLLGLDNAEVAQSRP